jgi:hypothetical protein
MTHVIEWSDNYWHKNKKPYEALFSHSDVNIKIRHMERNLEFIILADCYQPKVVITHIGIYYSVTFEDQQTIYWDDIESGRYDEQQMKWPPRLEVGQLWKWDNSGVTSTYKITDVRGAHKAFIEHQRDDGEKGVGFEYCEWERDKANWTLLNPPKETEKLEIVERETIEI